MVLPLYFVSISSDCVDKPRTPAVREVFFQSSASLISTALETLSPPEKSEQKGFLFARNSPLILYAKLLTAWASLGSETPVILKVDNQSNKTVTGVKVRCAVILTHSLSDLSLQFLSNL